ncbi:MAG: DUF2285 domain-containing protein [Sphingomonas sp.]
MSPVGGFTFAEHPEREAPEARIIWRADLDPGTLSVVATPAAADDDAGDLIDGIVLAPWLTLVTAADGAEHAVLSDGWHHIRLDVTAGSLVGAGPVRLHYALSGLNSAERMVPPLRRFLHFCRHRRFAGALFAPDGRIERELAMLRVHDGVAAGASQREIAIILFGAERVAQGWDGRTDSLRSRVRRLVVDARAMARGGYRSLLRRR